ncbi:DUF4150 domain-containing protein [Paracoccus marinaquae]|uniref:DUF4150 domain-containing protein n=1 Tax=Paracoccus marinaquae TaxID=2841926 RepID=A0ABS6APE2_9RHOB|nr:DUF4150 domain-containing protein [Paracoccus marinaquae]MBU3031494.1 DUF4150 domain-containing protein [Paracoccus marinaquae]
MTVFANGLEISAKKQGCKVIAAFPDTCFTPPQTPATPPGVPVPYPDFGQDGDLTSGTGTVTIGGETVSQENSSKLSKCTGDEAGSAPKKGIITSKNTGAVYAQKWSMDVKFEGKGVVRFGDIATSNHASTPGDSAPTTITGKGTGDSEAEHPGQTCTNKELRERTAEVEAAKALPQEPILGNKPGTPSQDQLTRWLKKGKNQGKQADVCKKLRSNRDRINKIVEARERRETTCFHERPGEATARTKKKVDHMEEIEREKVNRDKLDSLIKGNCT